MLDKLLRNVYRMLLWAHPSTFRDEFGDEMLLIFDELTVEASAAGRRAAAVPLLADCLVSVLRQWFIDYQIWKPVFALGYWFAFLMVLLGLLARRGIGFAPPH